MVMCFVVYVVGYCVIRVMFMVSSVMLYYSMC